VESFVPKRLSLLLDKKAQVPGQRSDSLDVNELALEDWLNVSETLLSKS